MDLRVGVQEEDIGGSAGADALVVRGGEAEVVAIGDKVNAGEIASHHVHRAVVGGIVHDDDPGDVGAVDDRAKGSAKQVAGLPGDDADVELCGGGLSH